MAKHANIFAVKDKNGMMTAVSACSEGRPSLPGSIVIDTDDMLNLLKKQVRADDFSDDDEYLQMLIDAAREYVLKATNRTDDELINIGDGDMPRMLVHAMLLIAGHWYNQREAVTPGMMNEVPHTYSALVKPYVKLVEDK